MMPAECARILAISTNLGMTFQKREPLLRNSSPCVAWGREILCQRMANLEKKLEHVDRDFTPRKFLGHGKAPFLQVEAYN